MAAPKRSSSKLITATKQAALAQRRARLTALAWISTPPEWLTRSGLGHGRFIGQIARIFTDEVKSF